MEDSSKAEQEKMSQEIPAGQIWFDRIFFWFILSLLITGILYTGWGLIEIANVPPAP